MIEVKLSDYLPSRLERVRACEVNEIRAQPVPVPKLPSRFVVVKARDLELGTRSKER